MVFTKCGFPHGILSVYTMVLGISSYLLALSSSWGCYFIEVDFILDSAKAEALFENQSEMGMGLFSFEDKQEADYTCRAYSPTQLDDFLDRPFRSARIFGILSNIFLGLAMLFFILISCVGVSTSAIKGVAIMVLMGSIFTWLQFIVFASDICDEYECTFFFGAALCLICGLVSLVNAAIAMNIPEQGHDIELDLYADGGPRLRVVRRSLFSKSGEEPDQREPPVSKAVLPEDANPGVPYVEEKVLPDGRTKIVNTVRNPDGSRRVEETILERNANPQEREAAIRATMSAPPKKTATRSSPPTEPEENHPKVGVPVFTEKVLPDGRKQIIKTIHNGDGSRTVEETTIAA